MAEVTKSQPVYVVPTVPTKGQGLLPIPPGRGPVSYNATAQVGGVAGQQGPFYGPGLIVPAGMTVRLRGNPGNAGNCVAGFVAEDVIAGKGDLIAPNTEIIYPVDNTANLIFWFESAGDGITLSIRNE